MDDPYMNFGWHLPPGVTEEDCEEAMTDKNTPSVPDSAATLSAEHLAKYIWDYVGHNTKAGDENVIFIREIMSAFGRSQYERGVRDGAHLAADFCWDKENVEKLEALLPPSEGK